jgi:CRP-like cAMP-binding protein
VSPQWRNWGCGIVGADTEQPFSSGPRAGRQLAAEDTNSLRSAEPGAVVGEVGMLRIDVHTASVVAETERAVLVLTTEALEHMKGDVPALLPILY